MEVSPHSKAPQRIVFFDGVCGLCNTAVDQLLRWDVRRNILFSPLQGDTAKSLLDKQETHDLQTIVYFRNGRKFTKSGAVLRILWDIGGWRACGAAALIIPAFLRNAIYDWVARNRYKWFGQKEACRIPTKEERSRFLP